MKYKNILIIGLGKSGLAAAKLAKRQGLNVFVTEAVRNDKNENRFKELEKENIKYEVGNTNKYFEKCDLGVISPGINPKNDYIKKIKKNMPIISEIEFAYKYKTDNQKIIGITGTNGKSTVTTLIYEFLKADNKKVALTGNIGYPLSYYIDANYNYFSIELSSYQLEQIEEFKPDTSVFLNISPDHLNRYDYSLEKYFEAKKNIFNNQTKDDYAVLNWDQRKVQNLSKIINAKISYVSSNNHVNRGCYLLQDKIVIRDNNNLFKICNVEDVAILGIHNLNNILFAVCATFPFMDNLKNYKNVLKRFKGLEHRLEYVSEINEKVFINDSKGTNIEATEMALKSFKNRNIVLILGGDDSKKSDYSPLYALIKNNCRHAVLIGETKNKIKKELENLNLNNSLAANMEEAVKTSNKVAKKGDIILLSPASASFDMFDNFEHRGNVFKENVMKIKENNIE